MALLGSRPSLLQNAKAALSHALRAARVGGPPQPKREYLTAISPGDAAGWLVTKGGPGAGTRILVASPLVIGRGYGADVNIEDPSKALSRFHARVFPRAGRCVIEDLGSQNGVWVNGQRVSEAVLADGDQIGLGSTSFVFKDGSIESSSVAAQERVARCGKLWDEMSAAVDEGDQAGFTDSAERLITGPLREALGYRVDARVPYLNGIAGFVVSNPMLWIRHSRFPVFFVAYTQPRSILSDLVTQVQLAQVGSYFALVVIVPSTLTNDLLEGVTTTIRDPVYRYDFVVLDRSHVDDLVRQGTPRKVVDLILAQGVDLSGLSPYILRGPVPESMFFGRERESKLLAQATQAYAVVGGRRIGKTSLLMKVTRTLRYDPACDPLYLNCEDKFELTEFLSGMTDALEVTEIADLRGLGRALRDYQRRSGKKLVCLLDEVDELIWRESEGKATSRLLATLRTVAFEHGCRFVFCGGRILHRLGKNSHSELFNFCEWMTVRMLDVSSVAEIVTGPLGQLGFEIDDPADLVTYMMHATGGHPNLVQWLCDRLVKTVVARRISVKDLADAATDSSYYEHLVETTWGDVTPLERLATLAVASPTFTKADYDRSMAYLGVTDMAAASDALSSLQLLSVLEGHGMQYRFCNSEFVNIVRRSRDVNAEIERLLLEIGT